MSNPFSWQSHRPLLPVARNELLAQILPELRRGGSVVLLGGHGIGKSVLLRQVASSLGSDARVMVISSPPVSCNVDRCLAVLAREFGVESPFDFADLFDRLFQRDPTPVVLLYDEADTYGRTPETGDRVGRALFDALESVRRDVAPRLAVLIAGGLGLLGFRQSIGSNFLSRATWISMCPLDKGDYEALTVPLRKQLPAIAEDVIDTVRIASGRNAALVTYGFGRLWDTHEPTVADVVEMYSEFTLRHAEFARDFWRKIDDPDLSRVPRRLWECILENGPTISRELLTQVIAVPESVDVNLEDGLRILQSAGLIEVEGSTAADPLRVMPLLSILSLPKRPMSSSGGFEERLRGDLVTILSHIHSLGVDFITQKGIVPEAVFSATIAIALRLQGWRVEREALRASGRSDLAIEHPGIAGRGVIEVKIWGRNDYKDIQEQLVSYCTVGTTCAFAVTMSAAPPVMWPNKYESDCLVGMTYSVEAGAEVEAAYRVRFATSFGSTLEAGHLLVRVPHRGL